MRRELTTAIAALKLASADRAVRLAAAKDLQNNSEEAALPAIDAALAKESDAEVRGLLALTKASIELRSGDKAKRLAAVRALGAIRHRRDQDAAAAGPGAQGRRVRRAGRADSRRSAALAAGRRETAHGGRHRRAHLLRHLARHHPAAGGAGARDHLRPHGRHQHGARRADHDRRLRDLRRAEPVPAARAGAVRLLSAGGGAGGLRDQRGCGRGPGAHGDPASLRSAARNAARDVGPEPHPHPGRAHDLRRAERPGRESGVDVRRRRDHDQRRAAVEPRRHHRVRRHACCWRCGWC